MTCGQDITVPSLVSRTVIITCSRFNGTDPNSWKIYKDGTLTQYDSVVALQNSTNSDYGTYTFVLITMYCGADVAVSRILQQGQFL